jgi:hypothetical protein
MRKTQNNKLQLVDVVLEARKKNTYLQSEAPLDVLRPKLHKLSVKFSVILKLWVGECKWVVG